MRRRELLLAGLLFGCGPSPAPTVTDENRTMRTALHNDVRIATQAFGSPGDPPLVLVMGATASMLSWPDELCDALARRGLFVIRFDHRDTGASTSVPLGEATYSVEDMAGDVRAVMDTYGLTSAHLMGMSLGAYISQILAVSEPARVRSLTLFAAEPLGWEGPALPHISDAFMAHFGQLSELDWSDKDAVTAFLLEIDRLSAGTGAPFDEHAARARIEQILARTDTPSSMFNHSTATTRQDWANAYQRVHQPVLVIHGEDDPVLPLPNGQAMAEGMEHAALLRLPGVGHELPARALGGIADRVANHVKSVG